MTKLTKGQTIFYLDTDPRTPPSKDEPSIFELNIKEENGKIFAIGKDGPFTIRFDLTSRTLDSFKILFATRAEAVAAYEASVAREVDAYQNQSKEEFFMNLFQGWLNDLHADQRVVEVIKDKVKTDFGIDVDQH